MATNLCGCKAKMPKNLETPPLTISTRSQARKRHASGQEGAPAPHEELELVSDHQDDTATDSDSGIVEERSISETASVRIQL